MSMPIPIIIPKSKAGIWSVSLYILVLCLIVATVNLVLWIVDQKDDNNLPDLNSFDRRDFKEGFMVKGNITLAFDAFAEGYQTENGMRKTAVSNELYYVIPIYETDNDGYIKVKYFMAFKTDPSNFNKMDKIIEQTWTETENVSELKVRKGKMTMLADDLKSFYYSWAESPDFYENGSFIDWCAEYNVLGTTDKIEIRKSLLPFLLVEAGRNLTLFWICIIFAFIAFVCLMLSKKSKKAAKESVQSDDSKID